MDVVQVLETRVWLRVRGNQFLDDANERVRPCGRRGGLVPHATDARGTTELQLVVPHDLLGIGRERERHTDDHIGDPLTIRDQSAGGRVAAGCLVHPFRGRGRATTRIHIHPVGRVLAQHGNLAFRQTVSVLVHILARDGEEHRIVGIRVRVEGARNIPCWRLGDATRPRRNGTVGVTCSW